METNKKIADLETRLALAEERLAKLDGAQKVLDQRILASLRDLQRRHLLPTA